MLIRSLKIKKNKASSIKIIIIKKKKLIAARFVKILGSLFNIMALLAKFLVSFMLSCCLPFLPALIRSFEIIKIKKNKNKAINIIIPNEVKFEI